MEADNTGTLALADVVFAAVKFVPDLVICIDRGCN
jgi:hypothetical protein